MSNSKKLNFKLGPCLLLFNICFILPVSASDWEPIYKNALNNFNKGQISDSESLFKEALDKAENDNQAEPGVINCLIGLAMVNDRRGNFAESDRLYELAMRTLEKVIGTSDSPRYANYLADLADLYDRHDRDEEAELVLKKLLDFRLNKQSPKDEKLVVQAYEAYAKYLRRHIRPDEATVHENKAAEIKYRLQNQVQN